MNTDEYLNLVLNGFPHCDSLILHRPSICLYCAKYKQLQQYRIDNNINFTGEYDKDKEICPAEMKRNLPRIERWHGNINKPPSALEVE